MMRRPVDATVVGLIGERNVTPDHARFPGTDGSNSPRRHRTDDSVLVTFFGYKGL